jgi:hypothetical protein
MHPLLGVVLTVGLTAPARADEQASARALIDQAVQAMGGEAKLGDLRAVTWKAKGTFQSGGQEAALANENSAQLPDRFRFVMELEANGNTVPLLIVMNRERGWIQANGQTSDLPGDFHRSLADCCYAFGLALMPQRLKDKEFRLSPLGEIKINDRPAAGVRVSRAGRPDVNLYFDKSTHLPVKAETRVTEPDTKQEVAAELSFGEYREFDGIPAFT